MEAGRSQGENGACQGPAGHLGLCAEPASQHGADCDSGTRSRQTWAIAEQGARSTQTGQTPHGHQHGELLGIPCALVPRYWEVFRRGFISILNSGILGYGQIP